MPKIKKLNNCANLLYYWLKIHHREKEGIILDTKAFQIWSTEFFRNQVTQDDIIEAILTLKNANIITYHNNQIFWNNNIENLDFEIAPLPVHDLVDWKKYERDNNPFRWGLVLLVSLLTLWGGCFWLSLRMAQLSPSTMVIPNSYPILIDNSM